MGATAIGATIYFGSEESTRQIQETAAAFEEAHQLEWPPFYGAIPETASSKQMKKIITQPQILQDRRIT